MGRPEVNRSGEMEVFVRVVELGACSDTQLEVYKRQDASSDEGPQRRPSRIRR